MKVKQQMKPNHPKKTNLFSKTAFHIILLGLITFFCGAFSPIARADNTNTISIHSAADLIKLTQQCRLDTWSQNKVIELTTDIDLSAMDFSPIPTFGGTFHGNGHTISGLNLTQKGSYQGLFRYIQPSGKVENLTVTGYIAPEGTPKYLGGIAGKNYGTISHCNFNGYIYGKASIGGIAGFSEETGTISNCTANGTIMGENYTGGIIGQNYGIIKNCHNDAEVNTSTITTKHDLTSLELQPEINLSSIRSTENLSITTDTGGIAGFSKGSISDCKNFGTIGYPHVGYNTGGICGRQAGTITNCENNGTVYGRKDVGGICGQAEPYIIMEFTQDSVKQMITVLQNMQSILDGSLSGSNHQLSAILEDTNASLKEVLDATQTLSDDAIDYSDQIITDANELLDAVALAMDHMETGLDNISTATKKIGGGLSDFEDAADTLTDYLEEILTKLKPEDTELKNKIAQAITKLKEIQAEIKKHLPSLGEQGEKLKEDIQSLKSHLHNPELAKQDLQAIWEDIQSILQGFQLIEEEISIYQDILEQLKNHGYIPQDITALLQQLKLTEEKIAAIKAILADIKDTILNFDGNFDGQIIQGILKDLQDNLEQLAQALEKGKQQLKNLYETIKNWEIPSPQLKKVFQYIEDGIDSLERGTDYLTRGTNQLSKALKEIRKKEPLSIPEIDDDFRNNLDHFFDSVDAMQNNLSQLNTTISNTKDDLINDLTDINREFLQMIQILSDTYDRQQSAEEDGFIEDVSNENIDGIVLGKIAACQNFGAIQADVNTGGIVGAMAIEYDFDPEDDIIKQGEESLRFTYKTKAIIQKCQNKGIVTGKKNYVGSIVGRMDLGTVISCEGYGNTESTDGNYVGGIAGLSKGYIRNSVAKCDLAGKDFIGGIAGQGSSIKNCYTLVNITQGDENIGAISGIDSEETAEISKNYFVSQTLGGIDGISYRNRAEETDIQSFCTFVKNTFQHEVSFTLTFIADETVIATVPFFYQTPIDISLIPDVPKKSGYYGAWTDYDYQMPLFDAYITAEYFRAIDLIAAAPERQGKPILLVCGPFDDQAQVSLREAEETTVAGKKVLHGYQVKITDTTPKDSYQVRYLPQEKNSQIILAYTDTIQTVNTTPFGSYLEFTVPGHDFTLYEVPGKTNIWFTITATIVVSLGIFVGYKRKNIFMQGKNQSQQLEQLEQSQQSEENNSAPEN